jgi:hypothetical protein
MAYHLIYSVFLGANGLKKTFVSADSNNRESTTTFKRKKEQNLHHYQKDENSCHIYKREEVGSIILLFHFK